MELISYYLLFALSTAIAACYLWFWPMVQQAKAQGIQNSFTEYPVLSTVVYVLISTIVAPLLVPPMLSETIAQRFQVGLHREIFKQD
jgi:uncharacterized membrane protein YdjX (TVP38/TMEM64 family)